MFEKKSTLESKIQVYILYNPVYLLLAMNFFLKTRYQPFPMPNKPLKGHF